MALSFKKQLNDYNQHQCESSCGCGLQSRIDSFSSRISGRLNDLAGAELDIDSI